MEEKKNLEEKCEHNDYCTLKIVKGKKDCYTKDTIGCRCYEVYEKYGEEYNKMFI